MAGAPHVFTVPATPTRSPTTRVRSCRPYSSSHKLFGGWIHSLCALQRTAQADNHPVPLAHTLVTSHTKKKVSFADAPPVQSCTPDTKQPYYGTRRTERKRYPEGGAPMVTHSQPHPTAPPTPQKCKPLLGTTRAKRPPKTPCPPDK